jgi:uncharacterized membrane protein YbhN (UPF0104 family)
LRTERKLSASLFRWLYCVSLAFGVAALYREDALRVDLRRFVPALVLALPPLLLGFVSDAMAWRAMLRKSGYAVNSTDCVAAIGLSIFAKYIPGKVWAVVGRAAYIASRTDQPVGRLSVIAINTQVLMLWVGLVLGLAGLVLLGGLAKISLPSAGIFLALTLVTFTNGAHRVVTKCLKTVLRRDVYLPRLGPRHTFSVMGWCALTWLSWAIGFQILIVSLDIGSVPWSAGLAFPLAAVAGVIALIAPGGLGVREGVLFGVLMLAGLSRIEATSVALASRLWFVAGEAIVFVVGELAHRRLNVAST